MDKEGQNATAPVFHSESIGNKATPEYFSNVKGGKKDQEKVEDKRSRVSRKTLFTILGALVGALVIVLVIALVANLLSRPKGSRTDETMPSNYTEIEERTYKVLYSGDENGYENAIVYLNDLIKDMKDLNQSSELIFAAYAVRARVAYQAGAKATAISEALRLASEADTNVEKLYAYHELFYMYNQEGDTEKRDFYGDLLRELDVSLENDAVGGLTDEDLQSEEPDTEVEVIVVEEGEDDNE